MRKTITAHIIVRNEEKWIWFSIMSVIDFMDQLLIYDTGSTDQTVEIIKEIQKNYRDKIIFEEKGAVCREEFVRLRREQVERTQTDYFLVVDGDEIHYREEMEHMRQAIETENVECGIFPFIASAGDVYHYRDPKKELYTFDGKTGAMELRLVSMHIPGVTCGGDNDTTDGYYDGNGVYIVPENGFCTYWSEDFYLHMSYMLRSSSVKKDAEIKWPGNRINKLKTQSTWDYKCPKYFKYPEVFYLERPDMVEDPWKKQPFGIRSILQMVKVVVMFFRR